MVQILNKVGFFLVNFLVLVFLVYTGFGFGLTSEYSLGLLISLCLIAVSYRHSSHVILPKYWLLYLIIVLLALINLLWSGDKPTTLNFTFYLLSGGLVWVSVYNYRSFYLKIIPWLIVCLCLFFSIFYLINHFGLFPLTLKNLDQFSLYLPFPAAHTHNHLGDLWSLGIIISVYFLVFKKNLKWLPILILGVYFTAISMSRSSHVSLIMGLIVLYASFTKFKINPKIKSIYSILALALILFLFIFASIYKPTFSSRIYYLQGLKGLMRYPFGVGMGNFVQISQSFAVQPYEVTTVAHNLILEFISGMGILAVVFIYWLFKQFKYLYTTSGFSNPLILSIFIALTTNFMLDFTYTISTLWWLWFIILGLV